MKKMVNLVSVTGIQRQKPSLKVDMSSGSQVSRAHSDDCPADGDGDDDGGGSDCPAGV